MNRFVFVLTAVFFFFPNESCEKLASSMIRSSSGGDCLPSAEYRSHCHKYWTELLGFLKKKKNSWPPPFWQLSRSSGRVSRSVVSISVRVVFKHVPQGLSCRRNHFIEIIYFFSKEEMSNKRIFEKNRQQRETSGPENRAPKLKCDSFLNLFCLFFK